MTESKKTGIPRLIPDGRLEKVKLLLSLLLSLFLIATAAWFIVSGISIYISGGDTPYSRETVASHLKRVAPISLITLALLISAGVISLFTKEPRRKSIPIRKKTLLSLFKRRLAENSLSEKYLAAVRTEEKRRLITLLSSLALSLVFSAVALIFVLNPARYSLTDINTDIAYSVVIASASTVLIFAICFSASYFLDLSYSRELEATKEEIKSAKENGTLIDAKELGERAKDGERTVLLVRIAVLAVAVAFIIAGVFNGGMADVLGKAVRICTECIGLG